MSRYSRALVAALLTATALANSGMVGCRQQSDTPVVSTVPPAEERSGLTALQRGQVRGEALAYAKAGWAAWQRNDLAAIERYFGSDLYERFRALDAQYKQEGRTRIHAFEIKSFDVMDLNATGTQAIANVYFNDLSYYVDKSGARTSPTHKYLSAQLTLDRQPDGGWKIVRMLTAKEVMN